MLNINLVSEELKKEISLRRIYVILKRISCYFILIIVIYSIVLVFARLLVSIKFEEIVEQTTLISKNTQSYNSKVKEINSKVDFIKGVQNNFIQLSCFIKELDKLSGPALSIEQIKFNREKGVVILSGKAKERQALLYFKDKLGSSGYFTEVDLPLENLFTKTDIDFEITAKTNLENFK